MKNYTDYTVLCSTNDNKYAACRELSREVKEYFEKGWEPQGGVSISVSKHGYTDFYTVTQAMVKVERV